jgi:hypothetical protein
MRPTTPLYRAILPNTEGLGLGAARHTDAIAAEGRGQIARVRGVVVRFGR